MRLLVGEIFNFSDLREREPFPEAPVYEVLPFRTEPDQLVPSSHCRSLRSFAQRVWSGKAND
jgi:hypothetical protein